MSSTRSVTAACLIAMAASSIGAQEITTKYDRFTNRTTVVLSPMDIGQHARLGGLYSFEGTTQTKAADGFILHFLSDSESWRYLNYHTTVLLMDGVERIIPDVDHRGHVGSGYVLEQIFLEIDSTHTMHLTVAKTIDMKVGSSEFSLSPDQVAAIRALAKRAMARP